MHAVPDVAASEDNAAMLLVDVPVHANLHVRTQARMGYVSRPAY